jgi:hypothetical protein
MIKNEKLICSYIVILSLFFSLLYMDIKPKISDIFNKINTKNLLINQIEANKKSLMLAMESSHQIVSGIAYRIPNSSDVLTSLTNILIAQGMTIKKIQLLNIKSFSGVNVLPVKIEAIGQFPGFGQLLIDFSKITYSILIGDFSITLDEMGMMSIEMQLFVFPSH